MTIRIEYLDTLDFTDIADTQLGKLNPIHPGEILREEFLLPLNMSVNALALALRVPATRLHEIVKERRAITPDTALRWARYFGGDAQFWLNLQTAYDRKAVCATHHDSRYENLPSPATSCLQHMAYCSATALCGY